MKILNTKDINQPIENVWKIVAQEFDQAHLWMSPVKHSYATVTHKKIDQAPHSGRVCELSSKPNGLYADEKITYYNESEKVLKFEVEPKNTPFGFPVVKNAVEVKLMQIGKEKTRVEWVSRPVLKKPAYLISPILKFGLKKSFDGLLNDLKKYAQRQSAQVATPA